jgi:hypothetical protein
MSNFVHYFTRLHSWYKQVKTFWFIYGFYLNEKFLHSLMLNLKQEFLKMPKNNSVFYIKIINNYKKGRYQQLQFWIRNEDEFLHAKNLLKVYEELNTNFTESQLSYKSRFHRLLVLFPRKRDFRTGKSIQAA